MKKLFNLSILIIIILAASACSHSVKVSGQRTPGAKSVQKARDYYLKGIFLQQEARYNEALVQFYQALHYDSTSATIYNSIAENHMKLGHFESAEILLRKALAIDQRNLETLNLLSECHFRLGRDDEAIATYKKVLQIDPYNDDARQYLILLYEKNGDEINVARQNTELVELYGNDPNLLERIANIYFKHKKYDKALHYYNEVLKVDSTQARILFLIGRIQEIETAPDEAIKSYIKAIKYKPDLLEAVDRLTFIYRTKQEWQKIIDLYQPLFEQDSTAMPPRILMAESHFYLDQYDKARSLLLPIVQKKSAPLSVLELMGRINLEAKNYSEARDQFQKILESDKKNKYVWLFLAFTYSDSNQAEKAQETYEAALKELPEDAGLWSFYGINLQEQEKYDEAVQPFLKALELEPGNLTAITNLPVVYETLSMYSKSDSLYEAALMQFPENDLLLNNFSYSLSERNIRLQEALKMSQRAVDSKPDNAAYLDTFGWILYKLGNWDEAEKNIKKSLEIRIESPVVLEHLGDVYIKKSDREQALRYWQQSLDLDETNLELRKKIEKNK